MYQNSLNEMYVPIIFHHIIVKEKTFVFVNVFNFYCFNYHFDHEHFTHYFLFSIEDFSNIMSSLDD